ncbi:MAG: phosphorylase, partial [Alistipes sp.]
MRIIAPSELIINGDGSIFHLHLKPGQLADTVILVGDPGRVEQVAAYFDSVECRAENREFVAVTGECFGKRMTVQSTGIGTDNIDIVVNELDALAISTSDHRKAENAADIGGSGPRRHQPRLRIDLVLSRISAGFDGLLNFYKGRNAVCDLEMEQDFVEHTGWSRLLTAPYFVRCSDRLAELFADRTVEGMTISAPGFYAPQGRFLRLSPADPSLNGKIESFEY